MLGRARPTRRKAPNVRPPRLYDQRGPGFDPVVNGRLAIGSFEVQAPSPTPSPTGAASKSDTSHLSGGVRKTVLSGDGYRLDVSTNSSFTSYVQGYQNLDVGNRTSYSVTGLGANTFYYYRLRAYNGGGTGPNSNVVKVKTRPH